MSEPYQALMSAVLLLAAAALFAAPARAQTLEQEQLAQEGLGPTAANGKWNVTLGPGLALIPTYPGARAERLQPFPLISIAYDGRFFFGPFGLGIQAIDWNGFHAGPVLGFQGDRRQDFDPHLAGLGNIPTSATAGVFAAYRVGAFEVSGTLRQAVTHTANGLTGLAQFNYHLPLIPRRLDLIAGPEVEFGNAEYEQTWFGVSPSQSMRSGLPEYSPGSAVTNVGLHAGLTYHYSAHLLFHVIGNVKEFVGTPSNSPIVERKTQGVLGFGIGYHF